MSPLASTSQSDEKMVKKITLTFAFPSLPSLPSAPLMPGSPLSPLQPEIIERAKKVMPSMQKIFFMFRKRSQLWLISNNRTSADFLGIRSSTVCLKSLFLRNCHHAFECGFGGFGFRLAGLSAANELIDFNRFGFALNSDFGEPSAQAFFFDEFVGEL